jgi:Leucine-rich repeat (LRR) protein
LALNASQNQIEELDIFSDASKLAYLQKVNLAQNQIKELPPIFLINLVTLNLTGNLISSAMKFTGHPTLRVLELRRNKLTTFAGIKNLPNLQELYAAENELTTLEGLENLPSLKKLNVRKNPVIKYQY